MTVYEILADVDLAALIKQHDEGAFRELYERYDSLVYSSPAVNYKISWKHRMLYRKYLLHFKIKEQLLN